MFTYALVAHRPTSTEAERRERNRKDIYEILLWGCCLTSCRSVASSARNSVGRGVPSLKASRTRCFLSYISPSLLFKDFLYMYSFLSRTCLLSDMWPACYLRTREREERGIGHDTRKMLPGNATKPPRDCEIQICPNLSNLGPTKQGLRAPSYTSPTPICPLRLWQLAGSERTVQQWGEVVAVVAAVKEEVGRIEDGEIAMEGDTNAITSERGSVGERSLYLYCCSATF